MASAKEDMYAESRAQIENEANEEENEDEEDEEYAEAEPVLTYSRMKNDINEILLNDSVSCIKAGHKVNKFMFRNCL